MRYFLLTDLEGAAGVDCFSQTRTDDLEVKRPGMEQLTLEVNACIEGIKQVDPEAEVDVIDGHGNGGLIPENIRGGQYINLRGSSIYKLFELKSYHALMFVGQHAMAGTIAAPLNHTFSSRDIMYYRLNDIFIGEFAARTLIAGLKGSRTIFLSGDDKAAAEAQMFIPQIETAITKYGKGLEAADHLTSEQACKTIKEGAARSVQRMLEIPPFTAIQSPFNFEARYYEPCTYWQNHPDAEMIDQRTVRIKTQDLAILPF